MRTIIISLLMLSFVTVANAGNAIQLATNGKTNYQIVVADEASTEIRAAAWELAEFLGQITGAEFPIVAASQAEPGQQIILGQSKALADLKLPIDWEALGPEGFLISTVGNKLVIAGGPRRGTINGVYTFLEDEIGCRWYTPTFSVIPRKETLSIGPLDLQKVPVFESRFVYCGSASDADWAARQRLNTFTRDVTLGIKADGTRVSWNEFISDPKLAGSFYYARNHVHTLGHNQLLAMSEFDEHPEYFAVVKGKRLREGQPCLTHPELVRYIAKRAKDWLKSAPGASAISISQGDFANACECPNCQAAYQKYGQSGVYLRFVNQIADEIGKDYPDVLVDTLAYQWTRQPPKNITMHRNVVIRYAPIVGCSRHAYDDESCKRNRENNVFGDLVEWIRISPRVWVWYYAIAGNEIFPYPNITCLSRDFKGMRDVGVKGFFVQMHAAPKMTMTGGLIDLKAYLFAKLMWDPDYNVQQGIEEFVQACYGAAAPQVLSYVRMVNDPDTYAVQASELHPTWGRIIPIKMDKLIEMNKLFRQAEQAVVADPDSLQRLKLVRLSLQYAIIRQADKEAPIRRKAVRDFLAITKQANIPLPPDVQEESP